MEMGTHTGIFYFCRKCTSFIKKEKKNEFINIEIDLCEIETWLTDFNYDYIMHNRYIFL